MLTCAEGVLTPGRVRRLTTRQNGGPSNTENNGWVCADENTTTTAFLICQNEQGFLNADCLTCGNGKIFLYFANVS